MRSMGGVEQVGERCSLFLLFVPAFTLDNIISCIHRQTLVQEDSMDVVGKDSLLELCNIYSARAQWLW